MRIRIHRGAKEIGGNCIEVEANDGSRIVLDIGRPLAALRDEHVPLPEVAGFEAPNDSLLGVIISHGHQDHWGLISQVPARVPVYIGASANNILKEASFFSTGVKLEPAGFLRNREPFMLGPFKITPFLNDHSAFDTYSLLIEADGKRLFYSADLQGHGRKARVFEELLRKPPANVDVLLMEGTTLRPEGVPHDGMTERQLEAALVDAIQAAPGIVLAMYAAQNIDRLVTWFRACRRAGRLLIVDLYTASIAKATGNKNIPQGGFDNLLVYVPQRQRIQVKQSGEFERVNDIRGSRIFPGGLAPRRKELVLTFRASMIREVERTRCLEKATAVWSMWPGYLEQPGAQRLLDFLDRHQIPLIQLHASGHAYMRDLRRFAHAMAPKRIVPIHSSAPHRFSEFFDAVELHDDGQWWEC
jgi:ribonuclease J